MKRNWKEIPARIISIERKHDKKRGILRIEAVLESRESNEVEEFNVTWIYDPPTSDVLGKNNVVPECFFWAYEFAREGINVILYHCQDDDTKYFYYC